MSDKKTSQARGDARRQAIVAVATELFLEKGFDATSVNEIVRRAGGSLATLYGMFDSKEAMFEAIAVDASEHILEQLQGEVAKDRPVRATLIGLGLAYVSVLSNPRGLAIYRLLVAEAPRFPKLREIAARGGFARGHALLRDFLETKTTQGSLAVPDAAMAASQLFGMWRGTWHMPVTIGAPIPDMPALQAVVQGAVEVFLASYGRQNDNGT